MSGDCGIRAITHSLRDFGIDASYGNIAREVSDDYETYVNTEGETQLSMLNANLGHRPKGIHDDTIVRLMFKHTGVILQRIEVLKNKVSDSDNYKPNLKSTAMSLEGIASCMLICNGHVVACRDGVLYDTWDSRRRRIMTILCHPDDEQSVNKAVKTFNSVSAHNDDDSFITLFLNGLIED